MSKENNRRKFPGGKSPRPDFTESKKTEAKERQDYYNGLSIEKKIVHLNDQLAKLRHLGKEPGNAKRQLEKLMAALEKQNAPVPEVKAPVIEDDKKHMKAKDRRKQESV